jgi:hypothetical protein
LLATTLPRISFAQAPAAPPPAFPEQALRAMTLAAGYVAPKASLEDDGRIVGSNTEGRIEERSLSVFDVVHVDRSFDGRGAAVGDTLLVYRDAGELQDPGTQASLGRVVYPTAVAVVTEVGADVASAVLTDAFAPVQAGQRVQYLKPPAAVLPAGERTAGEGVVVGFRDRSAILEPYAVVYLDLARGGELAPGADVRLVRPATEGVRRLPDVEIGSARVLAVGETAATAVLLDLARSDLRIGDGYQPVASGS